MMRPLLSRCAPRAAARSFIATRRPASAVLLQAARPYSVKADVASETKLRDLDPSQLVIEKTKNPKPLKEAKDLIFGRNFTGPTPSALHILCPLRC
jgi:branched-chain amino acid aminotransferase